MPGIIRIEIEYADGQVDLVSSERWFSIAKRYYVTFVRAHQVRPGDVVGIASTSIESGHPAYGVSGNMKFVTSVVMRLQRRLSGMSIESSGTNEDGDARNLV